MANVVRRPKRYDTEDRVGEYFSNQTILWKRALTSLRDVDNMRSVRTIPL